VHLKKLDLGKNKIQKIEGLETLTSLVQLSLEDNEIESMAGLRYAKRASYHP
jgi:Leucine-rich repeat (LRR) protein